MTRFKLAVLIEKSDAINRSLGEVNFNDAEGIRNLMIDLAAVQGGILAHLKADEELYESLRPSEEPRRVSDNDPMPPFPQEPAFGSPEAVAQAAGRLQNPPSGVGMAEDQEISVGLRQAAETIRGKLETLRRGAHPESANGQPYGIASDLLSERDALRAEVERLRAELVAASLGQEVSLDLCKEAERQRDALADALEAFIPAGCTCPDNDCLTARAALRLAGRLPEVADGPHS